MFCLLCSGFADKANVVDFSKNRQKYEQKCKSKDFVDAMKKVDEFIKNPSTSGNEIKGQISVKQESVPVFKHEAESVPFEIINFQRNPMNSNNILDGQIKKLQGDKVKIVNELMLAKTENQKIYLDLQKMNREIENLKHKHQQEVEQMSRKNEAASQEIKKLSQEKKILQAQIDQLKMIENVCPNSDSHYEVEKLLDHRTTGRKMTFLVRWKNYGPEHDSWVKKADLHCEEILKTYMNSKRLL